MVVNELYHITKQYNKLSVDREIKELVHKKSHVKPKSYVAYKIIFNRV